MKTERAKTSPLPTRELTSRESNKAPVKSLANTRLKQIVVAVDFSPCSETALRHACDLAKFHEAPLLLVSVVEPPRVFAEPNVQPYADWDKSVLGTVRTQLDDLVKAEVPASITLKTEVRIGKASAKIIEAAQASSADLIVIGTHGYTGIKHFLLGSTAERVVRDSHCSVLVVHESDKAPRNLSRPSARKILAPVDFSPHSKLATQYALGWGENLGANVDLLNIVPIHYAAGEYDLVDYQLLAAEQLNSGEKQLAEWAQALGCGKAPVRHGRPSTEIVEFAHEHDFDLIVIATRGQTGLKHLLLGSTTEEVVRHARCPVLVLRW